MPTKDRTKTRVGRNIEAALTALNDQYTFFLFLEAQFLAQLSNLALTAGEKFTTEVFAGNRYASKIHVRLRALKAFGEAHRSAASYEIASSFTSDALEALQKSSLRPLNRPPHRTEGPEQYYMRALASWRLHLPASELIETLSFMRHRRNSLIHLGKTPSLSFSSLAAQSGPHLNTFWAKAKVQIDFKIAETKPLEERETLDLLKLLRIIIQRLDTHFSSIVDVRGLVQSEATRLFETQTGRINMERRMATLRERIRSDYGLSPGERDLRAAAQSVGTRHP